MSLMIPVIFLESLFKVAEKFKGGKLFVNSLAEARVKFYL